MTLKQLFTSWSSALIIIGLFVASSYVAREYNEPIAQYVHGGPRGAAMGLYVLLTILATVIPPVTSLPLLPMAASVWGAFAAGIITAVGWLTGSIIAFFIARRYGQAVVRKLVSEKTLRNVQGYFPSQEKGTFWFLVLLQVVLPVDVLSYGAGLFTRVPFRTYVGATALGMLPGAMFFSYVGTLSLGWQLVGLALGGLVLVAGALIMRKGKGHRPSWRHAFR